MFANEVGARSGMRTLERRPLAFKVSSKFFWAYAILLYTQTRSLVRVSFLGGGAASKNFHSPQYFCRLGLMRSPFLIY
jgi:hypothetical protein